MDMRGTIVPRSDQLNADDLIAGPRTVTIERVDEGNAEQPVNIHLVEYPGRPYKPSKSMRRVLTEVWGWDTDVYHGRSLTLFRNEKITFGRDEVGGIQISHMSHMPKRLHVALTVKRGSKKPFTVEPLKVEAPAPVGPSPDEWRARLESVRTDVDGLLTLKEDAERAGLPQQFIDQINDAGMALSKEN